MIKELKVVIPPILTYQFLSYPLCIALQEDIAYPWFYSDYTQLVAYNTVQEPPSIKFYTTGQSIAYPHAFYNCEISPFITELKMLSISHNDKCIRDFETYINNDLYIWGYVDTYYIPGLPAYNKSHYMHDLLIYGYDDTKRIFKSLTFNKNHIFGGMEIPYDKITESFSDERCYIVLNKYKKDVSYSFNKGKFIGLLKDFIYENDSEVRNMGEEVKMGSLYYGAKKNNWVNGLKVYSILKEYIKYIKKDLYINDFTCIEEHKNVMLKRLQFLTKEGYLDNNEILENYTKLHKESQILKFMVLKHNLSDSSLLLNEIYDKVCRIEENDFEISTWILSDLSL